MILTIYLYTNIRGAIDTQGYVRADIQTYGWKEKEFCIGTYIFICIYNYTYNVFYSRMANKYKYYELTAQDFTNRPGNVFAHLQGVH